MNSNEPAFPPTLFNDGMTEPSSGLSKREWFAAKLSAALIEANHLEQFHGRDGDEYLKAWDGDEAIFDKWIAKRGTEMADALLAELEKKK